MVKEFLCHKSSQHVEGNKRTPKSSIKFVRSMSTKNFPETQKIHLVSVLFKTKFKFKDTHVKNHNKYRYHSEKKNTGDSKILNLKDIDTILYVNNGNFETFTFKC